MTGRVTQLKYAAAGKCQRCGEEPPASETLCLKCATEHSKTTANLKAKHMKAGKCAWCGKRNRSGFRTCDSCREKYNERRRIKASLGR